MMANTFYQLLELSDLSSSEEVEAPEPTKETVASSKPSIAPQQAAPNSPVVSGLHYNIQIHLPATKDLEVYNAIFKSLKENLIE